MNDLLGRQPCRFTIGGTAVYDGIQLDSRGDFDNVAVTEQVRNDLVIDLQSVGNDDTADEIAWLEPEGHLIKLIGFPTVVLRPFRQTRAGITRVAEAFVHLVGAVKAEEGATDIIAAGYPFLCPLEDVANSAAQWRNAVESCIGATSAPTPCSIPDRRATLAETLCSYGFKDEMGCYVRRPSQDGSRVEVRVSSGEHRFTVRVVAAVAGKVLATWGTSVASEVIALAVSIENEERDNTHPAEERRGGEMVLNGFPFQGGWIHNPFADPSGTWQVNDDGWLRDPRLIYGERFDIWIADLAAHLSLRSLPSR